MRSNEETRQYLQSISLCVLQNFETRLKTEKKTSHVFDALKVAIAFIDGALASKLEIGYEAYYSYMDEDRDNHSVVEKFLLRFLIKHGLLEAYKDILKSRKTITPPSSENALSSCRFFVNKVMDLFEINQAEKISLYLYLSKVITEPQRKFLINDLIKNLTFKKPLKKYSRNLILDLQRQDYTISTKWENLITYYIENYYNYRYICPFFDQIFSRRTRMLDHCGYTNMLCFLMGNMQHGFCLKETALLIQLQMIAHSLQTPMQEKPDEP